MKYHIIFCDNKEIINDEAVVLQTFSYIFNFAVIDQNALKVQMLLSSHVLLYYSIISFSAG